MFSLPAPSATNGITKAFQKVILSPRGFFFGCQILRERESNKMSEEIKESEKGRGGGGLDCTGSFVPQFNCH